MDIKAATLVYTAKAGDNAQTVNTYFSQRLGKNIIILKNIYRQRLACVVESKRGYVVDIAKKS